MIINNVVCPFCGCLCDDLSVKVENNEIIDVYSGCKISNSKFCRVYRDLSPRVEGNKKVDYESAINEAINILRESTRPLLYGWSSTVCEAHRIGIQLAEKLGGIIDNTASVCHGPSILAIQDVGIPSCTLGEIKNRADLVIYWGANPMNAHPRHLSRYTFIPRGFFSERGMRGRKLVVIDVRKTDTAEISDIFIKVKPNQDFELLSALRLALFSPSDVKDSAGVKADTIIELANLMKSATMGAIFFGLGLTMSQGKHRNIDIAINLTKDLNKFTKFIIMPMRGHFNVTGFNVVCTWQTGFPFSVDFSRGYPRYNPGEFSAVNALQRHEVDCALIVASDPVSHFPKIAVDYLLNIPVITLDPFLSPTGAISQVFIPAAISGIECDGTAYRMDHVPIRLKKIIDGKYPSDKVILEKILEGVSK